MDLFEKVQRTAKRVLNFETAGSDVSIAFGTFYRFFDVLFQRASSKDET